MVDSSGNPRIMDFGLSTIIRDPNSYVSASENRDHTPRWTAPEILGSDQAATEESDVFSFGMVMIEVGGDRSITYQRPYPLLKTFTGEIPFTRVPTSEVVMRIMGGDRPSRPTHPKFTDSLWELTKRCWETTSQDRPKMKDVLEELSAL
jgi:serine/threonine protein kinase